MTNRVLSPERLEKRVTNSVRNHETDVLVVGGGIAGLTAALKLARTYRVTVLTKTDRLESNTRYAQGGIASVWAEGDSFDEHQADTLRAGAGLCHAEVVKLCVEEGPARVQELITLGVPFTQGTDPVEIFDLHREGGHGRRRILHADDRTGYAIQKTLVDQASAHPHITILENHLVVDLITEAKSSALWHRPGGCIGAYVLDTTRGDVYPIGASVTILATGGAGKVYRYTSNPDVATGDGIAIAHRAGARVANLEFMQFHPTCLFHPGAKNFLISEALRGEGAVLRNIAGDEFMSRYHAMGSLAPRDVVARAIDQELKRSGDAHVWLDARGMPLEEFSKKFPGILDQCGRFGIFPPKDMIPVVPAAHYMCGGVVVNHDAETTVPGLFAIGEVSCTGLHGANRLASNSLLEAVVFSHRAAQKAERLLAERPSLSDPMRLQPPPWQVGSAVRIEDRIDIAALWDEVRRLMWNYVGIVRSNRRLERARRRLELIAANINEDYWNFILTRDLVETRNLVLVAQLIVQSALMRKESRGLHYNVDYPGRPGSPGCPGCHEEQERPMDTVI